MTKLEYLEYYKKQCEIEFANAKIDFKKNPTFENRKRYIHYGDTLDNLNVQITKLKTPINYEFIRKLKRLDDDKSYTPLPF